MTQKQSGSAQAGDDRNRAVDLELQLINLEEQYCELFRLREQVQAAESQYFQTMLRKQLELPPEVAQAFARDMRAYFKAKDQNKRDEIDARQRFELSEFQGPRDKKLRVTEVIKLFHEMKDQS